ncbi:unnamed protein product, partial [Closterium sp. NIES-54]
MEWPRHNQSLTPTSPHSLTCFLVPDSTRSSLTHRVSTTGRSASDSDPATSATTALAPSSPSDSPSPSKSSTASAATSSASAPSAPSPTGGRFSDAAATLPRPPLPPVRAESAGSRGGILPDIATATRIH